MKNASLNLLAAGLLMLSGVCHAQGQAVYRSVGPNGVVTYSDTLPPTASLKPPSAGAVTDANPAAPSAPLPYELQQVASRYPVTLYTAEGCAPCGSGRILLTARGIPFAERTVVSAEDIAALQRLSGDASLPFLTIGGQQIRGFSDTEWSQFLDAAGYPKTSMLPAGYRAQPAAPLVAVQRAAAAPGSPGTASGEAGSETATARPRSVPAPARTPETNPAGIRF